MRKLEGKVGKVINLPINNYNTPKDITRKWLPADIEVIETLKRI